MFFFDLFYDKDNNIFNLSWLIETDLATICYLNEYLK